MTKRTWRFASLRGQVADVMASSTSLRAAAQAPWVNLSTVVRWRKSGKIPPPGRRRPPRAAVVTDLPASSEGWAAWARQTFDLSGTEAVLVDLAADALVLARDPLQSPMVRLNAAARFQQLVRQLDFEEESSGQTEASDRIWPRRVV